MKIKVLNKNKSEKFKKISILLPTSLIKTKMFWKQVYKNNTLDKDDVEEYIKSLVTYKKIYKQIKKYVKANGHFVLLEVISNNYCVKIIL